MLLIFSLFLFSCLVVKFIFVSKLFTLLFLVELNNKLVVDDKKSSIGLFSNFESVLKSILSIFSLLQALLLIFVLLFCSIFVVLLFN